MNNKKFLMFVKCIQDALPDHVPIIEISYWCISGCRLKDHSMASTDSLKPKQSACTLPTSESSPRSCLAFKWNTNPSSRTSKIPGTNL